ncbi:MAG: hypothetical protein ACP5E5_15745, partial [Acidobacteriaceae bacterium]
AERCAPTWGARLHQPSCRPCGEICMGCGWTPSTLVDMSLLTAVEAVNGGERIPAFSEIPFWERKLNLGYRLTAIGGSDNHRPMSAPVQKSP